MTGERIELNCSTMEGGCGVMSVTELFAKMSERNMPAIAVTDYCMINAFPFMEQIHKKEGNTTRPIYGVSLGVRDVPDGKSYTVEALVRNEVGKKNLFRLFSNIVSDWDRPIFAMKDLNTYREGLLLGIGMRDSKLKTLLNNDADDEILAVLLRDYDYVEVLPEECYREENIRVIELCDELDIPVVAVSEASYIDEKDKFAWEIMCGMDDELSDSYDHHIRTTQEMLDAFSYLPKEKAVEIVVDNTHLIADMCEEINICKQGKFYPEIPDASNRLATLCLDALMQKYDGDKIEPAKKRLEFELEALKNTHMETYVLNFRELLEKADLRACDISMRGVAAGSIVAYLLGISEINPFEYNLTSEFIFGYDGFRQIDIDINVSPEIHSEVQQLTGTLEGVETAVHAGVTVTLGESGVQSAIDYFQEINGMTIYADYADKLRRNCAETFKRKELHPGGMILFPAESDYKALTPVVTREKGCRLTYFDCYSIDEMFVKMDILMHETPRLLAALSEKTGVDLADVPTCCDEVLELFVPNENGEVKGCKDLPEFKSEYVRHVVGRLTPVTFDDLVKIESICHGTGTWVGNGEILTRNQKHGIKDLIGCREDVFDFLVTGGIDRKTAYEIAEEVRKGKVSRNRCRRWSEWKKLLSEAKIPDWFIWSCEQIGYLFPRAHAVSYLYMNMRLGWFKVHYPKQFNEIMGGETGFDKTSVE